MSWGDLKKSYAAGADAYRESKSRWVIPIAVVVAVAVEICRRYGISWVSFAVVIGVVLTLFIVAERYIRRRNGVT